jgi:hypothetical protein
VPTRRRTAPSTKVLVAIAILAVLVAGIASSPGRALLDSVREAVGVEHAQPALFSLPASGRLLVVSDDGPWIVQPDGSKRRLGDWREASWSPFGRFVVASRRNELVALTPEGDVRWSLARPNVRFPRWGGTETDTRIAYFSNGELRVVGGDGGGDRLVDERAALQPPVWRLRAGRHLLGYERRDGTVRTVDADTGSTVPGAAPPRDGDRQEAREVLGEAANLAEPVRSADGRWLAVGWPEADQLVFIRTRGGRQIRAVSNVSAQFRSRTFPTIAGWCCPR